MLCSGRHGLPIEEAPRAYGSQLLWDIGDSCPPSIGRRLEPPLFFFVPLSPTLHSIALSL
jgi:hypothetical protein